MLAIGSDHAGYELKCEVKKFLDGLGVEYIDCGCNGERAEKYTRLHNDANVLCMGGRVIGAGTAEEIVRVFLSTEFEGGRHAARVDKMMALENK